MFLPFISPGGHRAYKNSKKPGYAVFIEQFPGGAAQWLHPEYLAALQTQNGGGEMNGAGGIGAAPPNFPPNGIMPPHVHGQAGMPVFPQGPGPAAPQGGMMGGGLMQGGMPLPPVMPQGIPQGMPQGIPQGVPQDMGGGMEDGLEGGAGGDFDQMDMEMQNLAAQQGGGTLNFPGDGGPDLMDAAAFLQPHIPGPNTWHLTPAALGAHTGPVHHTNPFLGLGHPFANPAVQMPHHHALPTGQHQLNLGGGALGGHTGPIHTANPLLGVGNAFANWAVQIPPANGNASVVRPWYQFPDGPPATAKKKRKAFVVRRVHPEEQVHMNAQGGGYPRVKGLGEFRGGRFY